MDESYDLRGYTLHAEWPWACHYLDKTLENREQAPPAKFVGPGAPWIAMHAGASIGGKPTNAACRAGLEALAATARSAGWGVRLAVYGRTAWSLRVDRGMDAFTASPPDIAGSFPLPTDRPIITSAITGLFRIREVFAPMRGPTGGWRARDQYALRIDYRPLPTPIPCKGALGWWRVPAEVAAQIQLPGDF